MSHKVQFPQIFNGVLRLTNGFIMFFTLLNDIFQKGFKDFVAIHVDAIMLHNNVVKDHAKHLAKKI